MPWCKFFVPKIASSNIQKDDPAINDHIMYAKCIKGHVLRSADQWLLCENLPAPDATCWQEGGDTIFSLQIRKRANKVAKQEALTVASSSNVAAQPQASKS